MFMLNTLAVYIHDIDPYAIMLWQGGPIRWYGVSYLVGFIIGWLLIRRVLQKGISTFKPAQAVDIVVTLAVGVVVGGRLGYAVFYDRALLWTFTDHLPYWNLLALNHGGMASHGGMIGMAVAAWWIARRMDHGPHRIAHVMDLGAFAAPLGLGIGRIANFINGELYGRAASASLPWGMKFPQEMFRWNLKNPDPQTIHRLEQLRAIVPGGQEVASNHHYYLMGPELVIQKVIEMIQNGNPVAKAVVAPMLTIRHPSQFYQAIGEGVVLFTVMLIVWARPKKPLVVGGTFCTVYAVQRIIVEQFRMPDVQLGYEALGLTQGQWLSIFLLVAGVIITIVAATRNTPKMGGWLGQSRTDEPATPS
jgi:phosphatidylglycerol:prolipoprotein diacylglycerol transferase